MELDARGSLLRAALGFLAVEPRETELVALHRCFDNWRGIGDVVAGMARQDYDLELRRYDGPGLARDLLSERFRALHDFSYRHCMGPEPVGRGARSGEGYGGKPARQDWTLTDESPR